MTLYPDRYIFYGVLPYTYGVRTVLVVDDDEDIRGYVRKALGMRGWTVLEAEDGVDGVARFMLHYPDVLLTDISMPNSDGFEMIELLRDGGDLDGVRVVIMSGVVDVTAQQTEAAGVAAVLRKPFKLQALYEAVGD